MSLNELVNKLCIAGAVEKREGGLTFTMPFASYLMWFIGTGSLRPGGMEGWNEVLGGFDPLLVSLSCDDIISIIQLLEYYLSHTETTVPAGQ